MKGRIHFIWLANINTSQLSIVFLSHITIQGIYWRLVIRKETLHYILPAWEETLILYKSSLKMGQKLMLQMKKRGLQFTLRPLMDLLMLSNCWSKSTKCLLNAGIIVNVLHSILLLSVTKKKWLNFFINGEFSLISSILNFDISLSLVVTYSKQ